MKSIYLNQQRIIMDKDATPTSSAEPLTLPFAGQMLSIYEPAPGKISISFDQIARSLRYQIKDYSLDKINFKTVLAGLKNTHPQIISAALDQNEEAKYQLSVTVTYEFLPQVKEIIVFQSKTIPKEQSQQANVRNLRNHIKGMREQLICLGNLQTISGPLDENGDTQIFVPLSNKKTVFTLSLSLTSINNQLLRTQMYYYNSVSKQRKSSGAVPEQGVFLHHNGSGFVQIKFFAEFQDFDMVSFRVQGKNKGEYILAAEKVEIL